MNPNVSMLNFAIILIWIIINSVIYTKSAFISVRNDREIIITDAVCYSFKISV